MLEQRHQVSSVSSQELSTTLKSAISLGRWNGTQVVVKSSGGVEFTEELLHEIEVLSSLRHPDLVMFLGACLDDSVMCVTEYLPGGDLERYYMKMRQEHQQLWHPDLLQVLHWSSAVSRALAFLHNRKVPILHRDVQLGREAEVANHRYLWLELSKFGLTSCLRGD